MTFFSKHRNTLMCLLVVFLSSSFSFAGVTAAPPDDAKALTQQTISGKVTDATGFPLAGANVIEKGTSNGTQTKVNLTGSVEIVTFKDVVN